MGLMFQDKLQTSAEELLSSYGNVFMASVCKRTIFIIHYQLSTAHITTHIHYLSSEIYVTMLVKFPKQAWPGRFLAQDLHKLLTQNTAELSSSPASPARRRTWKV